MLRLFGMRQSEYKRFLNFLARHNCPVDFRRFSDREYGNGGAEWTQV
jgi:hypothetical protein